MFDDGDSRKAFVAMVAAGIWIFRPPLEIPFSPEREKEAAEEAIAQAEVFVDALEAKLGSLD